jgi:ribosomal protein L21
MAVIQIKNMQYLVSEGEACRDRQNAAEPGSKLNIR